MPVSSHGAISLRPRPLNTRVRMNRPRVSRDIQCVSFIKLRLECARFPHCSNHRWCTVQPPAHCTVQPRTVLYSGKKAVALGHKYLRGGGQMMIIRVIVTRGCVTHRWTCTSTLLYCTWCSGSFIAFPILQQNQIKGVSQYLDLSAFSNHQEQDNSVHFKCAQEQVVLDSTTMYRQCGYLWIFIGDH